MKKHLFAAAATSFALNSPLTCNAQPVQTGESVQYISPSINEETTISIETDSTLSEKSEKEIIMSAHHKNFYGGIAARFATESGFDHAFFSYKQLLFSLYNMRIGTAVGIQSTLKKHTLGGLFSIEHQWDKLKIGGNAGMSYYTENNSLYPALTGNISYSFTPSIDGIVEISGELPLWRVREELRETKNELFHTNAMNTKDYNDASFSISSEIRWKIFEHMVLESTFGVRGPSRKKMEPYLSIGAEIILP